MSDKATLRRLLRQISDAKRTEEIIIAEEAIVKLFDAVRDENFAETAVLRAEAAEAIINGACAAFGELVAYRRANALNFQLEKFDDYLRALETALKGGEK